MSSKQQDSMGIICCGSFLYFILLFSIWILFPEYVLPFLGVSIIVIGLVAYAYYTAKEEEKMRKRGLVKYKGKWGTPRQVFEWQQLDKGLVKYQGNWITPEEKTRREEAIERERRQRELFEIEQRRKGLVKFTDRFGQEHWGSPQEIEILRKKDFEEQQKAKGLVKYRGEWITPDQAELLKFKNEKTPKALTEEIASYIRESSVGTSLNSRTLNKLTLRFWLQKYRSVLSKRSWDPTIASKMREAEGATLGRYLESLTEELTQWAQDRNLMRLTKADVKLFLISNSIRLSTSLEQMLYRQAKLKYRYLPPWKRK